MKIVIFIISFSILIFFFGCSKDTMAMKDDLQHPDSSFLPVIFLCGQSNMEGVQIDASLPGQFKNNIPNAYIFFKPTNTAANDGSVQTLKYGLNNNWRNPAIYFGPETGMAYYLTQAGHRIAIVKYAYGGSKLSFTGTPDQYGYWQVNATDSLNHYNILINNWARQSMVEFRKAGFKPYIAAMVWCQGETDAHDLSAAREYEKNLTQLLNKFKADLSQTDSLVNNMRVIITSTGNSFPYSDIIRKAQKHIANSYLNGYLINSDGWQLGQGGVHYTSTTEAEFHGKAIADILLRVIP